MKVHEMVEPMVLGMVHPRTLQIWVGLRSDGAILDVNGRAQPPSDGVERTFAVGDCILMEYDPNSRILSYSSSTRLL